MAANEHSSSGTEQQKVCEWCLLPKFGENRCICDSPKFELMAVCDGCGEWTDVDRLFFKYVNSEEQFCFDCSLQTATERDGGGS